MNRVTSYTKTAGNGKFSGLSNKILAGAVIANHAIRVHRRHKRIMALTKRKSRYSSRKKKR